MLAVRELTDDQEVDVVDLFDLRLVLCGELILPGDPDYDAARSTLYITLDRRPLAIARVIDVQDVAATVRFAFERSLPLAVRSGGHSLAHYSVIDNAIVIDLSGMKRVDIVPEQQIARVEAGATSGDLAGPANAHGLALSTGDTHSVGMGGLTTGGGIGFMVRKYGLAIDNLLAAQIVTADGQIVTASADEHSDLFWAIRGGGGNFGIVNHLDADDSQLRTRAAYGDNYERLVAIKNKYDPTNFFRLNNNIAPTGD